MLKKKFKVLCTTKEQSHEEWLKSRQAGIGGSDAGAIFRVNKWKSPFNVYIDKVEPILEVREQSESAYWGNQLEEMVAKEFTNRTGKKVRKRNEILQSIEYPFMLANLDREVVGENALLECKTTGSYGAKEWEDEEIPASYLIQVMHYLAVTGYEKAYIACLIGGQKFVWKEIGRDEELIKMLIDEEEKFWTLVENKTPPALDGSSAAEKWVNEKYKKVEPGTEKALGSNINNQLNNLFLIKDNIKNLELEVKEIENQIKNELGETEKGYTNNYEVIWKQVTSNRVDSKVLKDKYPDIYKEVCNKSISRRFSFKEVRK